MPVAAAHSDVRGPALTTGAARHTWNMPSPQRRWPPVSDSPWAGGRSALDCYPLGVTIRSAPVGRLGLPPRIGGRALSGSGREMLCDAIVVALQSSRF
jgi:hypothetical protein